MKYFEAYALAKFYGKPAPSEEAAAHVANSLKRLPDEEIDSLAEMNSGWPSRLAREEKQRRAELIDFSI